MSSGHVQIVRMLVVDDDSLFLRTMGRRARAHPGLRFDLRLANTVEKALKAVDEPPPVDVVLFDVCVPCFDDGKRLIEGVAQRAPMPRLVAMSGKAGPEEMFVLGQDGVCAFFTKTALAGLGTQLLPTVAKAALAYTPDLSRLARMHVGRTPLREVKQRVGDATYDEAEARAAGSKRRAAKLLGVQRQAIQRHERRGDREGS